ILNQKSPSRGIPIYDSDLSNPALSPAEQFRTLVMALISTVDLGHDRQPVPAGRGAIQLDGAPLLQPGIRIEPEIHLVTGKLPRQERPCHLRLQRFRCALSVGEIDIPGRADNLRGE